MARASIAKRIRPSADGLTVNVAPKRWVNRVLIQNHEPIFDTFELVKDKPGVARGVRVDVELHTGAEPVSYSASFDLDENVMNLSAAIELPLAWIASSVEDRVRANMLVRVSWGEYEVYRRTHTVAVLARGEWLDDDEHRHFLPSFVLPYDPAVRMIVRAALPFLRGIADDPAAGFDGYQSNETRGGDSPVDAQVRAIWSALCQTFDLGYINPPPSFVETSQRLRTPSRVMNESQGTCIDLALLFAACLEYAGIRSVVFILNDHAFPGYWRSQDAHDAFAQRCDEFDEYSDPGCWTAKGEAGRRELDAFLDAGQLVPFESVAVTQPLGFRDAAAQGRANLSEPERFCAMVDVTLARVGGVTPLAAGGAG